MPARIALITGVRGQDGTLLSRLLVARGYRVVGVVQSQVSAGRLAEAGLPPAPGAGVELAQGGEIELVATDLAAPENARAVLAQWQPDEVYHLAAFHHSSQENALGSAVEVKRRMVETNFTITQNLAFGMLEMGSRASLVFAGSSQMFTAVGSADVITERTDRRPSTFYGHVKSWSADLLAQLRADVGLRASTAILFNHESTLRRPQFVSRKITQAAAAARAGKPVSLEIGNSLARVDWSSANDVVQALALMASAAEPCDYIVASGQLHSVEDLLQSAFGACGLDWRQYAQVKASREEPALCGDSRELQMRLGWQPSVGFEAMIHEMVDHDTAVLSGV